MEIVSPFVNGVKGLYISPYSHYGTKSHSTMYSTVCSSAYDGAIVVWLIFPRTTLLNAKF